jgi:1-acyl-sn-glycerol-3-phosphate acyltransferase
MEKSPHKLKLIERIGELEKKELWHLDVEDDPETFPLMPEKVDYLNEKLSSKIMNKIANFAGSRFFDKLIKNRQLIIREIRGIKNFTDISGGKIVTCNHFSVCDNYAVWVALRDFMGGKMLYKIIREGNYTSFGGFYGYLFRHCNTLPLSSSLSGKKALLGALKKLFARGEKVLIYPEQSMWYNYKKPKPLKVGAFSFAVKNNVPVLPIFITLEDTENFDSDGCFIQAYTIHILPALYPDKSLKQREDCARLCKENYMLWKEVYEDFYGIPLEYTTDGEVKICSI